MQGGEARGRGETTQAQGGVRRRLAVQRRAIKKCFCCPLHSQDLIGALRAMH
jgi:hypothetical protein